MSDVLEKYALPFSIVIATLILSVTILYVGNNISTGLTGLTTLKANTPSTPSGTTPQGGAQVQPQTPPSNQAVELSLKPLTEKYAAVKGSNTATLEIVEFSDYQCPFCRRHFNDVYPQLEKEFVASGKAKAYFRDFPLIQLGHVDAPKGSEAARCAGEQGKYWEMHDAIFEMQNPKGAGTVRFSVDDLKQAAAKISGMDSTKLNECLDSGKFASNVEEDTVVGDQFGVNGTPSFYLIGKDTQGKDSKLFALKSKLMAKGLRDEFFVVVKDKEQSKIAVLLVGAQDFSTFKQTLDVLAE